MPNQEVRTKAVFRLRPRCPHCEAEEYDQAGYSPTGDLRRFRCKKCKKTWKERAIARQIEANGRTMICDLEGNILVAV